MHFHRETCIWSAHKVDMPLNEARETVLHVATRRSDKPMIHYLLSARADPVNVPERAGAASNKQNSSRIANSRII